MNRGWDARCTPTIERTTTPSKTDQAIRQVSNAIVDIGSYDDERERLTYHTEKLEEAEPAITLVRDNRYAKA